MARLRAFNLLFSLLDELDQHDSSFSPAPVPRVHIPFGERLLLHINPLFLNRQHLDSDKTSRADWQVLLGGCGVVVRGSGSRTWGTTMVEGAIKSGASTQQGNRL